MEWVIVDVELWIIWHSRFVLFVMLNISSIPEKLHLVERFFQKSGESKYCNFLNTWTTFMDSEKYL